MAPLPAGPPRWEELREVRLLGRGTYGTVHLVEDRGTRREYVVKRIRLEASSDDEAHQRLMRELEIMQRLKHPNIVQYLNSELRVDDGELAILMGHCAGGDLGQRIEQREGQYFDEAEIMTWFLQLATGLEHMHTRKIIHRDLKTKNLFLTRHNVLRIGDFGFSRSLGNSEFAKSLVGTPFYMAPEIGGGEPYNYKSDVWALGCVLVEMASLKLAFEADNMYLLAKRIRKGQHEPVPEHYSKDLHALVDALLQKDPEQRPSVSEVLQMRYVASHAVRLYSNILSSMPMVAQLSKSIPRASWDTGVGRNVLADAMDLVLPMLNARSSQLGARRQQLLQQGLARSVETVGVRAIRQLSRTHRHRRSENDKDRLVVQTRFLDHATRLVSPSQPLPSPAAEAAFDIEEEEDNVLFASLDGGEDDANDEALVPEEEPGAEFEEERGGEGADDEDDDDSMWIDIDSEQLEAIHSLDADQDELDTARSALELYISRLGSVSIRDLEFLSAPGSPRAAGSRPPPIPVGTSGTGASTGASSGAGASTGASSGAGAATSTRSGAGTAASTSSGAGTAASTSSGTGTAASTSTSFGKPPRGSPSRTKSAETQLRSPAPKSLHRPGPVRAFLDSPKAVPRPPGRTPGRTPKSRGPPTPAARRRPLSGDPRKESSPLKLPPICNISTGKIMRSMSAPPLNLQERLKELQQLQLKLDGQGGS